MTTSICADRPCSTLFSKKARRRACQAHLSIFGLSLFALTGCGIRTGYSGPGSNTDTAWWNGSYQPDASIESDNISGGAQKPEISESSVYIKMHDGTLLAAQLYLPVRSGTTERVPVILVQTRYYRKFEYSSLFRPFYEGTSETIRRFVEHGYAWVEVDVRGTGASTGVNRYPWSPEEVADGKEVVDWIIAQPWSNGVVGSTGISYDGTSAEMLATNLHPAIRAIAPRFALYDVYTDVAFPGGVHNSWFTQNWSEGNKALDDNEFPSYYGGMGGLALSGILPVESDTDGSILERAIDEHQKNGNVHKEALALLCIDDRAPSGFTTADISPSTSAAAMTKIDLPIYGISGWLDGAYQLAAINRFLSVPSFSSKLTIGPWNHGGRQQISPYGQGGQVAFDQVGELIRFFDRYLRGIKNGIDEEPPVHYFVMGREKWRSATTWPPETDDSTFIYLSPDKKLLFESPRAESAADPYKVRNDVGSGTTSRWRSLYNIHRKPLEYSDREELCGKLLCYTSDPLPWSLEVTGHPTATITLSTSADDGQIFIYLEEIAPDGSSAYITEGMLRFIHRRVGEDDEAAYRSPAVFHTFKRADASRVTPGEPIELKLSLLPTSYRIPKGHRIRLLIGGNDQDLTNPVPKQPASWTVYRDRDRRSRVELPLVLSDGAKAE